MEKTKYVLGVQGTDFYDPHGSPDDGGSTLFVSSSSPFIDMKPGEYYYTEDNIYRDLDEKSYHVIGEEEGERYTTQTDEWYGEDGYNCQIEYTQIIREITEEEYHRFKKIIEDYQNIR